MTIWFIYFAVGIIATTFGSLAGLGGGVIIKPVLDLLGHYDVGTISILSAATVFSMAVVSLVNSRKTEVNVNVPQSLTLAIGSIIGGIIGKLSFNEIVNAIGISDLVTVIQSVMIASLMVAIYIFVRYSHQLKSFYVQNVIIIIIMGFILGLIAAFLGIGGGPFNVAILTLFFSMSPKESALNSIFIIFFSQISALLFTALTTGFAQYDLSMLGYMIVGGILGGYLGSQISKRISNLIVTKIFTVGLVGIIFISLFNIARYFIA